MRMKRSRYDIGKVKTRYNDNDKRDETPFVDNAVNPPNQINVIIGNGQGYRKLPLGQGRW